MRAAIVDGEHAALVVDDEDWAAPAAHHHPPLRLQLLDRPSADEIVLSLTHQQAPCARPGLSERWAPRQRRQGARAEAHPGRASPFLPTATRHESCGLIVQRGCGDYLREDPNGIGIVSQHLGHPDLSTTRRFYVREQTRLATQRYHEVLTKARAALPARRRRKPGGMTCPTLPRRRPLASDRPGALACGAAAGRLPQKPASRWGPARRRIVEQAYGQWLVFLDRHGVLDPSCNPRRRATDARLKQFVTELRARVAPVSAAMMLGALVRMLSVIKPEQDWAPLACLYNQLKQTAAPSRNKLERLVRASDLFTLGLRLMDTCEEADRPQYVPIRYRDGLIIALLIACPMRIKNLTGLVIGQHLIFDNGAYLLKLAAAGDEDRPAVCRRGPAGADLVDRWLASGAPTLAAVNCSRARHGAVSAVICGSIGTVGPCGARRSGSRSRPALGTPSARRSGHTCSGIAP